MIPPKNQRQELRARLCVGPALALKSERSPTHSTRRVPSPNSPYIGHFEGVKEEILRREDRTRYVRPHHLCKVTGANIPRRGERSRYARHRHLCKVIGTDIPSLIPATFLPPSRGLEMRTTTIIHIPQQSSQNVCQVGYGETGGREDDEESREYLRHK